MTFMGMRGTGDWQTDQRPKSWRETILRLYPNGTAPLTAIMSKMGSEGVDDPQFHWWTKMFQQQGGDITDLKQTAGGSAYADDGSATKGDVLYAKVTEDVASHFREGHQALMRNKETYASDTVGKVVSVVKNGDSSSIGVKLLENDNDDGTRNLNYIVVSGNINPEGGVMPNPVAYDPSKWFNYTQIFRTPLSITRTAMKTKLRTDDAYKEAKREALEYHGIEQERAMLFGIPTEEIGDNGKPERTTMGLIPAIRGHKTTGYGGPAGEVDNYTVSYSGSTWIDKGEEWLDNELETIFRYGDTEKLCFAGSGAQLGIAKLVKTYGNYDFTSESVAYGIRINRWTTPFGVINMIRHPLMSFDPTLRNSMVMFEPRNLKFRYIDDTSFYSEDEKQNTGSGRKDARDEEYLTEAGLEYHHPIGWGFLTGVGLDG